MKQFLFVAAAVVLLSLGWVVQADSVVVSNEVDESGKVISFSESTFSITCDVTLKNWTAASDVMMPFQVTYRKQGATDGPTMLNRIFW